MGFLSPVVARPVLIVICILLGGCAGAPRPHATKTRSAFRPEKFFEGETRSWGVVEDRFGTVRRGFTARATGRLRQSTLQLDQRFLFSDGKTERRVWTINRLAAGRYEGTAADVVGVADGVVVGNALHWNYTLAVPVGRATVGVHFKQRMLLQDGDVVVNRVRFSKFGVRLGSVNEFFQKIR